MPSQAFRLFSDRKKREVLEIARIFETINAGPGPNTNYSLLNGALVLLVSGWEVYCEGVCRQSAEGIQDRSGLRFEQLNECLRRDLIKYAGSKYTEKGDPLNQKLAKLPDGGWRSLLTDRLNEYLSDFNTPRFSRQWGKNLNELFRLVLGIRKVSKAIEDLLEDNGLCDRLDGVVTLRGKIAHTGDAPDEDRLSPCILRRHTDSFIEAAAAVDVVVHREFRHRLGFAPWRITKPVREALRQVACDKLQTG